MFPVCVAARLMLVLIAYHLSGNRMYLRLLGFLALIPAIGFMLIWMFRWRRTGVEVGGGPIWWDALRPVHSLLFATFAFLAIGGYPRAYVVLLADVYIGIVAHTFVRHLGLIKITENGK